MWFAEVGGNVGYVTPNGAVTEFAVGAGIHPAYITGLGGSLWFTATGPGGSNDVYQITTGGTLTQYVLPTVEPAPREHQVPPDAAAGCGDIPCCPGHAGGSRRRRGRAGGWNCGVSSPAVSAAQNGVMIGVSLGR